MKYNFDKVIDRNNTNSMNVENFKEYVFGNADISLPYPNEEYTRMWLADMEFETPEAVVDAIKERINHKIFGYTGNYDDTLYSALNAWTVRHYGYSFQKKHLRTSAGIVHGIIELIKYICKEDEKIVIFTPSYGWFKNSAVRAKREYVCCDLKNDNGYYTIDFDAFEEICKDEKVTMCLFCNPHNPTGRVWNTEELSKVAKICEENNMFLISDEIHCDLVRTNQTFTPMAKIAPDFDKVITCMALSKTLNLAGLVLSTIFIPNDEARAVWDENHLGNEHPINLAAAIGGYKNTDDWLEELKIYLDDNFKFVETYLKEHLPKAIFRVSESTYLAWINFSNYVPEDLNLPLFFCTETTVMVEGGNISFVQNAENCIRVNLAQPRSIVAAGISKICDAINTHFTAK